MTYDASTTFLFTVEGDDATVVASLTGRGPLRVSRSHLLVGMYPGAAPPGGGGDGASAPDVHLQGLEWAGLRAIKGDPKLLAAPQCWISRASFWSSKTEEAKARGFYDPDKKCQSEEEAYLAWSDGIAKLPEAERVMKLEDVILLPPNLPRVQQGGDGQPAHWWAAPTATFTGGEAGLLRIGQLRALFPGSYVESERARAPFSTAADQVLKLTAAGGDLKDMLPGAQAQMVAQHLIAHPVDRPWDFMPSPDEALFELFRRSRPSSQHFLALLQKKWRLAMPSFATAIGAAYFEYSGAEAAEKVALLAGDMTGTPVAAVTMSLSTGVEAACKEVLSALASSHLTNSTDKEERMVELQRLVRARRNTERNDTTGKDKPLTADLDAMYRDEGFVEMRMAIEAVPPSDANGAKGIAQLMAAKHGAGLAYVVGKKDIPHMSFQPW